MDALFLTSEKIEWVRKHYGYDTESFGDIFGISGQTIEGYEQGRLKIPQAFEEKFDNWLYNELGKRQTKV